MSKQYKIKDYSNRNNPFGGGPNLPWWKLLLSVLGLIALVFVGVSIYKPVYNFVTGQTKPTPPPIVVEEPVEPIPSPVDPETVEKEPEVSVPEKLARVQGVLLPIDVARDSVKRKEFLKNIPEGTNLIYLELKDGQGTVYYNSKVPQVDLWESRSESPLDLPKIIKDLQEQNLQVGVKLSVFSDPQAARGNLDNAIMHSSGVLWIDNLLENGGKPWTTPYSKEIVDYNLALVKEVSDMGVALVVLDHVYIPNDPTNSANINGTEIPLHKQLNNFIVKATEINKNVPVGLFLYEQQGNDGGEGGNLHNFGGDPTQFTPDVFVVAPTNFATLGTSTPALGKKLKDVIWLGGGTKSDSKKIKDDSYILIVE